MKRPHHKNGFTLIELSIVLVIIGLIVGGVLVGQDLIQAAKLKQDFATISQWNTAVNTFRLKYNALPGDLQNPEDFGFFASTGNGDKRITGIDLSALALRINGAASDREWYYVYHQLATAELMPRLKDFDTTQAISTTPGVGYPQMQSAHGGEQSVQADTNGGIVLFFEDNNRVNGHYYRMGTHHTPWQPLFLRFFDGYDANAALLADSKYDDGKPLSGTITIAPTLNQCPDDIYDAGSNCSRGGIGTGSQSCTSSSEEYVPSSPSTTARSCSLRIRAEF